MCTYTLSYWTTCIKSGIAVHACSVPILSSFSVSHGVKQGAVRSPILFNLVINQILVGMHEQG